MAHSPRGLRILKAINYYCESNPNNFDTHNILKKLNITSLSNGVMRATFTVEASMCNAAGTLHGGFIASALDTSSIYAQMSVPDGKVAWTTNFNINYIKPSAMGEKVTIETAVLKGGHNAVMEAIMKDESGALLAKSVAAFKGGSENYQKIVKDLYKFDVYEN